MISGIVEYSSSSDDEDESTSKTLINEDHTSKTTEYQLKRNVSGIDAESTIPVSSKRLKTHIHDGEDAPLPLPPAIQNLFNTDTPKLKDNPSEHEGRVRTFEHVEGNWATFVYIPVTPDPRLHELFTSLIKCLRPYNFKKMTDYHVTLSRTVVIRHHWIDGLMESLRENLSTCESCICDILEPQIYTNDDKTRTFVSLEIQKEGCNLQTYVREIDKSFNEFRLQKYYKNPSFHISVGWCLGDVSSSVSQSTLHEMKVAVRECFSAHPDLSVLEVTHIECKTGKKVFIFPLKDSDT